MTEQENKIYDWLNRLGQTELLKDFNKAPDKQEWWMLNNETLEKLPQFRLFDKEFKPLKYRLDEAIGSKRDWDKLSPAYKRDVIKELGVDEKTLDETWKDLKQERDYAKGVKERTEEIKEWPFWKKALASEYEKERYIKEPETSIMSDKGQWYNKGESISDLLYGGAGVVADLLPGVHGTVIGPAIRGLRDVQHKATDSKYQKDWSEIGGDVVKDLMFNVGTDILPTALLRKGSRVAKKSQNAYSRQLGETLSDAEDIITADAAKKSVQTSTDYMPAFGENVFEITNDPIKWEKKVKNLPEGPMKQDLKTLKDAPAQEKREALVEWSVAAGTYDPQLYKTLGTGEKVAKENIRPGVKKYYETILEGKEGANKLTNTLATGAKVWKGAGERAVKTGATIEGRPGKPQETEDAKLKRWQNGYATAEERKSDEYNNWFKKNTRIIMGLEE